MNGRDGAIIFGDKEENPSKFRVLNQFRLEFRLDIFLHFEHNIRAIILMLTTISNSAI